MKEARVGLTALLCTAIAFGACTKSEDVVIETAAGVKLGAEEVDRDPLALLPGGALGLMRLDAQQLFHSPFGQRLEAVALARVPLPPSAGFVPARDLNLLHVGLYSMRGADFAVVATGRFDPAAIEGAADGIQVTPLGAPLVKTTYAGRTLYVSRNVGFVVLTRSTVLLGNETGIRRALDRIAEGRIRREAPPWMESLLLAPGAPVVMGWDFKGQPPVQAVARSFPVLNGLETARVLGNFQHPGMNFAGTLTYPDPEAARQGVATLNNIQSTLRSYSFFMSLAGIGNPVQQLQAQAVGREAQFVMGIETRGVEWLIGRLAEWLGVPPQAIQARTSPAVSPSGAPAP